MASKYLVIDAHQHFMSKEVAEKGTPPPGASIGTKTGKAIYDQGSDRGHTVRVMDEAGIDMVVLTMTSWTASGLETCKLINDSAAKSVKEYPGRFIGCTHIPFNGRRDTLDEIDRAYNELGFRCICMVTSTAETTIDSPELFPVYEKVCKLDIPILAHPSIRQPIWGGDRYGMSNTVSREYDVLKATVEVLYAVLPKFPEIKIVMPHHGGGIPNLKGRVMANYEPEGWEAPPGLRKKGFRTPRQMKQTGLDKAFNKLFDKLYFDLSGFGGWMPITESAIKVIRADRLCFGTDYPFEQYETEDLKAQIDGIKGLDIPERDKRLMLGENIKNLLKV